MTIWFIRGLKEGQMALKVGIAGLGFMGKMHFDTWGRMPGVQVAAICDIDAKKRSGDWSGIVGNIGGAGKKVNLSGIKVYSDTKAMFADPDLDVIDITLPTYLHVKHALLALKTGKHVICEKPMAINSGEARKLAAAAKKSRGKLFIAHCIRFWPHYAVARDIIRSRKYGRVLSACFRRFSHNPTWSWQDWQNDPKKSGLAALDLHIHDADFVLYCFGKPKAVVSSSAGLKPGRMDHIHTAYKYPGKAMITGEGGWEYAPNYPFGMSFAVAMEKATLNLTPDLKMMLYPKKGSPKAVAVPAGDGYSAELRHFVDCMRKNRNSTIVTAESSADSVALVEAEIKSARTGKSVRVSF
jgi:predicted dehydrogenase